MKNLLFCIVLMSSIFVMAQDEINGWSIGANVGGIINASPVSAEDLEFLSSPKFGGHICYMLNNNFGIMGSANYANLNFPVSGVSSNYLGFQLNGVLNLGEMLNFNSFSEKFGLLSRLGLGFGGLWQTDFFEDGYESHLFNIVDEYVLVTIGVTPQLKIAEKLALYADLAYNMHIEQDRTFDFAKINSSSLGFGGLITISIGATYYIVKSNLKEQRAQNYQTIF